MTAKQATAFDVLAAAASVADDFGARLNKPSQMSWGH